VGLFRLVARHSQFKRFESPLQQCVIQVEPEGA
jgi:hypothetical protein